MQNTTPDPILVEPEHEVKIQSRKQQLIEIFEDQKTKILCDRGKNTQKNTNLSTYQQTGMKMLKQRASSNSGNSHWQERQVCSGGEGAL